MGVGGGCVRVVCVCVVCVCVWGGTTTRMHVYWSYLALVGDDPAFNHDPLVDSVESAMMGGSVA